MRVALLAVALEPASRSANIARVLYMIDRAARVDPAPDLIVVPAGCDRTSEPDGYLSPAMSESYWAALSAKAREWGVYQAAALRRFLNASVQEVAVLFDADGDEIALHRAGAARTGITLRRTLIGSIGLCFACDSIGGRRGEAAAPTHPRVMIVFDEAAGGSTAGPRAGGAYETLSADGDALVCRVRADDHGHGAGKRDAVAVSHAAQPPQRLDLPTGHVVTVVAAGPEDVERVGPPAGPSRAEE